MRIDDQVAGRPGSSGKARSGWLAKLRRKADSTAAESEAWTLHLDQVISDLGRMNQSTERDFLNIGGRLSRFIEAVDQISSELAELAEMMSAEKTMRASGALSCILDRLTKIGDRAGAGNGLLDGMLQEADQAKVVLSEFRGTVTILTTLGVLTQIETARLGAAGAEFGALSEDVKSVSGSVQERVERALQAANQLIPPIETALTSATALEQRQSDHLPSMVAAVLAHLTSFGDVQKRARESSARMRGTSGAISDAFKKLIVSLQFHDITRQQVEHVIEALRHLRSGSAANGAGMGASSRANALALQSSQLGDAADKFATSVAAISQSLEAIAANVTEMVEESRVLCGISEAETGSTFLQMEQACAAILVKLGHCANAEAANESTHRGLSETLGQLREAIDKIQAVEIQMERLSLNASVRAAHIGDSGDALAVLAGTMRQLASECGGRANSIIQSLDSMSQASASLSVRCTSSKSSHCQATMRAAVAELHASTERSFAGTTQIAIRADRLREDLSNTRAGFSVGPVFAESVSRAREALNAIAGRRQADPPAADERDQHQTLDEFAQRYTMQAERDVHAGSAGKQAPAAGGILQVRKPAPAEDAGEAVGENVEFF